MSYVLFMPRVAILTIVFVLAHVGSAMVAGLSSESLPRARDAATSERAATTPDDASGPIESAGSRAGGARPGPAESLSLLGRVVVVSGLEAIALGVLVAAASSRGLRLMCSVVVLTFGVMTFQPQIEAVAFGVMGVEAATRVGLMGLILSIIVAPISAVVFGRGRGAPPQASTSEGEGARVPRQNAAGPVRYWQRIAAAGVIYVAIYLVSGYFVAWQSSDVRAFYGGAEPGGFLAHVWRLQGSVPWFMPFQFARGCVWAGLALTALPRLSGSWVRRGAVVGLFFAVLMNAQLLLPNPAMPEAVRLVHMAETAPANFLLGLALALVFRRLYDARERRVETP